MNAIKLHLPNPERSLAIANPLPQLLQTPAGYAILEIQGTIHLPDIASVANSGGATQVGKVVLPLYSAQTLPDDHSWMKKVYLYVGKHQRMTGEVKKLGKPLAIIKKRKDQKVDDAGSSEEIEIADIVRYKIVFSQRPEPVGQEVGP